MQGLQEGLVTPVDQQKCDQILKLLEALPPSVWHRAGEREVVRNGHRQLALQLGLQGRTLASTAMSDKDVCRHLCQAANALHDQAVHWHEDTTIYAGYNNQTPLHCDNGKGLTALCAFGNYSGGRVYVHGMGLIDIHNKFVVFDSWRVHATEAFTGTRYVLAFYAEKKTKRVIPAPKKRGARGDAAATSKKQRSEADAAAEAEKVELDLGFNMNCRARPPPEVKSLEEVIQELLQLPVDKRPDVYLPLKEGEPTCKRLKDA